MCDNPCYFEPTFTFHGILISLQFMSGLLSQWKAEIAAAVTHLALLGVKIRKTALWGLFMHKNHMVVIYEKQTEGFNEKKNIRVYSSRRQFPQEDGS